MSKQGIISTLDKPSNDLSMARRHPAYRRHDLTAGSIRERAKLSSRCKRKTPSRCTFKGESTEARHGGRTLRSSDEVPVMGMERRARIILPRIGGNCLQEVR